MRASRGEREGEKGETERNDRKERFVEGSGERGGRVSVGYTYVCRPRVQCIQIARKRVVPSAGTFYR